LHHDQLLALQIFERDRLAREAMTRRADQHDLVTEERLEGNAAVATSRTDDAELELSPRDPVDDGLRVGDRQAHAHVRMLLLELAEQERDDRAAGPVEAPSSSVPVITPSSSASSSSSRCSSAASTR